ncbi:MAG TPA: MFS transporter [Ilumatobacter sp.]|nr:MFS transporter [Ilumatobacter sp.]
MPVAPSTTESAPVDRSERRALIAVAVQFFVNGAVVSSYLPRMPEVRDHLGITLAVLGLVSTLASAAALVSSMLSSRVIERFGTKRVLVYGATLNALMLPLVGFAGSTVALLAVFVVIASTDVTVDIAMNLQGSWLSARRKVSVMSRLHGLWSVGTIFGGVCASRFAAAEIELKYQLLGATVVLLVMIAYVRRGLLPDDHAVVLAAHDAPDGADVAGTARDLHSGDHNDERAGDHNGVASQRTSPKTGTKLLFAVGAAATFVAAMEVTSFDWAAFRLADDFGTSAGRAGLAFVVFVTGMAVGRLAGDSIQAIVGARRLTWCSIAVTGAGLAAALLIDNQAAVLAGYLVAGLGQATLMPYLYDAAAKLPGRRGAGLGALAAGIRVSTLTTPVLTGALASTSLGVGSAVAIVVLPSVIGFAVVTVLLATATPPQ